VTDRADRKRESSELLTVGGPAGSAAAKREKNRIIIRTERNREVLA